MLIERWELMWQIKVVFFQLTAAHLKILWTEGEEGIQREGKERGRTQGPLSYLYSEVNRLPQMFKADILHH